MGITEEVDVKFEVPALMKLLEDRGVALLFKRVRGYEGRGIVGNLYAQRSLLLSCLGVKDKHELFSKVERAAIEHVGCILESKGPVKENVLVGGDVDVTRVVPGIYYAEADAAPTISTGVHIAKDPLTGARICSIILAQVKAPRRILLGLITPGRFMEAYRRAEDRGEPLRMATAIGVDPCTFYASGTPMEVRTDKLDASNVLRGRPLSLVKAETVDVEVPAEAEIVVEGELLPKVREEMGPLGDYTKVYWKGPRPVIEVKAVSFRDSCIYQAALPYGPETVNVLCLGFEKYTLDLLRRVRPTVLDVYLPAEGFLLDAVISMRKRTDEDVRHVLLAALSVPFIKRAVVVDHDVDIYDRNAVLHAMLTRFQPDVDTLIVDRLIAVPLDPSSPDDLRTSKIGFDATRPMTLPEERFRVPKPPSDVLERVKEKWQKLLSP